MGANGVLDQGDDPAERGPLPPASALSDGLEFRDAASVPRAASFQSSRGRAKSWALVSVWPGWAGQASPPPPRPTLASVSFFGRTRQVDCMASQAPRGLPLFLSVGRHIEGSKEVGLRLHTSAPEPQNAAPSCACLDVLPASTLIIRRT